MGMETSSTTSLPARERWALLAISILAALLRFGDLGRQSPWIDEMTNWQMAAEKGIGFGRSGHWLTGLCQSAGLALFDSEWGLRLYAAIFGTAAVALGCWWLLRRANFVCGVVAGVLLALSPFGIFYSQDANHYAPMMMAGVCAAMLIDCVMERRWRLATVALLVTLVGMGFHPTGLYLCGVVFVTPMIAAFARTADASFSDARRRRIRIAVCGVVLIVASIAVKVALDRLGALWIGQDEGRQIGLNWDFLGALLACFYGAIYRFTNFDALLGVAGLALGIAGLFVGWRNPRLRWVAVGIACTILCATVPFTVIKPRQYFSPRYVAAASPLLLMAVALLFAKAQRLHWIKIVATIWIMIFAARSVVWEKHRLEGSFQPMGEAIAWLRENAVAKDGIVLTRHPYLALGTRFLWTRDQLPPRSLVTLSYMVRNGAVTIQQMRELLQDTTKPVYFLSLIGDEDAKAPDLDQWVNNNSSDQVRFESTATDAFVPIDWGVQVRRLKRSDSANAFALPRRGVDASEIFPNSRITAKGSGMILREGNAVAYNFDAETNLEGLRIEAQLRDAAPPILVVVQVDDNAPWIFNIQEKSSADRVLLLPERIPEGRHVLTVSTPLHAGVPLRGSGKIETSPALLQILLIAASDGRPADLTAFPTELVGESPAPEDLKGIHQPGALTPGSLTLRPFDEGDHFLFVRKYHVGGLGAVAVRDELGDGERFLPLWRAVEWNHGPMNVTGVVDHQKSPTVSTRMSVVSAQHYNPREGRASFGNLRVYRFRNEHD